MNVYAELDGSRVKAILHTGGTMAGPEWVEIDTQVYPDPSILTGKIWNGSTFEDDTTPIRVVAKAKFFDRHTTEEIGMLRQLYNADVRVVMGHMDWMSGQMAVDLDNQRVVDFYAIVVSKFGADNIPVSQHLIDAARRDELLRDVEQSEL